MSAVGRKQEAIDLIKLYATKGTGEWNAFLTQCYNTRDVATLTKTLYGVQAGMSNLVTKKLDTTDLIDFFLRLQKSLELTMKKIHRLKVKTDGLADKRTKDQEFEKFLRKESF